MKARAVLDACHRASLWVMYRLAGRRAVAGP
jgi:hypothetical protein